jgi:biopolymer transport protein ExbD
MATSSAAPKEPLQDINVLPLIDVLLVLIIVCFLLLRGLSFIPAQLPAPAAEATADTSPGPIVLALREDGTCEIDGQPIPAGQLDTQLRAIYDDRPAKVLFIDAAANRSYQEVVRAMDVARGAGVQVLALVPLDRTRAP